jgi:hypothetical protein
MLQNPAVVKLRPVRFGYPIGMETRETAIAELARKHGVRVAAVQELADGLQRTNGKQAQFRHPDLGGMGQWMPGMVMVGRMGDTALKAKVDALCRELIGLDVTDSSSPTASFAAPERWWTETLGTPAWTGGQNDFDYAYFIGPNRLAIRRTGTITVYDTSGYTIQGVGAQQQSGGSPTLTLSTNHGPIPIDRLPIVG